MSRAETTDLLQNFRFHAIAEKTEMIEFTGSISPGGEAGFQQITVPEVSDDAVEYREGTYIWTRKQPGIPAVSDMTLSRGIALRDTAFHDWVIATVTGQEYRTDITVYHYQRHEITAEAAPPVAERQFTCYNCFPIRVKGTGDLEASTGDISLAEVDVSVESIEYRTAA